MSNDLLEVLPRLPRDERFVLRLYVAGCTPLSSRAIANLKRICENHLKDRYDITVVDLCEEEFRAQEDQIVVAPTLIRCLPLPVSRMIGDLSQTDRVLAILGLIAAGVNL